MVKNAKWYHITTDRIRVSATSSISSAAVVNASPRPIRPALSGRVGRESGAAREASGRVGKGVQRIAAGGARPTKPPGPPGLATPRGAGVRPISTGAPADTTGSGADSTEVPPAPERGQVLGDFSLPVVVPDSLLAPMFPPGEHPTVPTGGFGAVGIPTLPDSCWGIQVAAPTEADRAESIRSAAQSLLLIPMKIDAAGGRFRVQTRDCMSAEVAEKLRTRAIDTGFADTFRMVGGNAGKEASPTTGGAGKKPKKR